METKRNYVTFEGALNYSFFNIILVDETYKTKGRRGCDEREGVGGCSLLTMFTSILVEEDDWRLSS